MSNETHAKRRRFLVHQLDLLTATRRSMINLLDGSAETNDSFAAALQQVMDSQRQMEHDLADFDLFSPTL